MRPDRTADGQTFCRVRTESLSGIFSLGREKKAGRSLWVHDVYWGGYVFVVQ